MYIWVATDVDSQLTHIRGAVEEICAEVGAENPALTLPLHISLKISCEIDDCRFDEAVEKISEYYSSLSPFFVCAEKIERNGNILWIKMGECAELHRIHNELTALFEGGYGIEPHPFDKEFIYHATLFYGEDESEAELILPRLQSLPLPKRLLAEKFVIGCSATGKAGDYKVIKEITLT